MLIDGRSIADPLAPFSGRIQHVCSVLRERREGGRETEYDVFLFA